MAKLNLKELFDDFKLAYIITNISGYILYKNKKADQLLSTFKINPKTNVFNSFKTVFPDFLLDDLLDDSKVFSYSEDEKNCYFEIEVQEKHMEDLDCYVISIYDISSYENRILDSEIYKTIFNSVASAIVVTDARGSIEKVNPSFEKLTGYSFKEAKGKNPSLLKSGYHSDKFFEEMWKTLSSGHTWRGNLHDKLKSGELIWEKSVISPIKDKTGKIIKYVAIKENITKEKKQEVALKKLSYQDYLTGLYNRRKFMDYTEKLISYAKKCDMHLFCLMIDVDNFKSVNDNYGHEVGDKVLVELSKALKANVRNNDIASRYGGEEFVVILTRYSYEQAMQRAEKIRNDIEQTEIKTNQEIISVTASIGFAQYDNQSSILEWIEMADKALYQAKKSGKNKICEYHEEEGQELAIQSCN